ncbi:WecB/TagA/CpsF family glycosyltransferase [Roseomonas elaeocarpi]|uniref:WecB/TagA/CpsF family glycosyltransferase n=1 Tax=Roseomonas elaeocarpi TaxID=907779 RepID=A0ABV6JQN0_9PROT
MIARENVLGVAVSAVNMDLAVRTIGRWIDQGERHYVCVTGVHGVMEAQRSPELMHIHNRAGMVTPDGMPLAWLLWLGGHAGSDRVCGPELMPALFRASQARGDRHFLYGASPATLALLQERLLQMAPEARIVGAYSPPFRPLTPDEDDAVVEAINASGADIVWVGLSTPKQEYWMASHRDRLSAAVLIGVGAAFDMHAGLVTRAPPFLRRTGLEWTYRLVKEPRRLWKRYLSSNPRFVALVACQKLGFVRRASP